jgi:hypothetical protein
MNRPSPHTARAAVVAPVLALVTVLTALVIAFAWPTSALAPRDLPVVVAGPPAAVPEVQQRLASVIGADAVDLTRVADRAAAVDRIRDRDAYAALVLPTVPGSAPELLVASAASPTVAQALTGAVTGPGARGAMRVKDVAPLPAAYPHGAVFALASVPLTIGGILVGALLAVRLPDRRRRLGAAIAVSLLTALAMTAVLQSWLTALTGSYLADAGVVSLGLGAVALSLLGLHRVLGLPGLVLGAVVMLPLGVPLSGTTSAPELLPTGWGTLGQLLPPGATGSALRSTAFFDGAGAAAPLVVLGCWAVAGLVLLSVPARSRTRRGSAMQRRPVAVPAGR